MVDNPQQPFQPTQSSVPGPTPNPIQDRVPVPEQPQVSVPTQGYDTSMPQPEVASQQVPPQQTSQPQGSAAQFAATPNNSDQDSNASLIPGQTKPAQEELVWEWAAPSRPYKPRTRQFYMTIAIIVVLVSLILFFAGQLLPIAVVISVAFLGYVLSSVPPDLASYQVTTFGVRVDGKLYFWEEMQRFWFEAKYGQEMIHIEHLGFPYRITLMLGDQTKEAMRVIFTEVLLEQRPAQTILEKAADWLQHKVPLDIE